MIYNITCNAVTNIHWLHLNVLFGSYFWTGAYTWSMLSADYRKKFNNMYMTGTYLDRDHFIKKCTASKFLLDKLILLSWPVLLGKTLILANCSG